MIVFKKKLSPMLDKLVQKLENEHIDDYEIVEDIPEKGISITGELKDTEIYVPEKLEFCQYDIDDYVRTLAAGLRTKTTLDRDIYRMKVTGKLTEAQFFKLVKFIIEHEDFCSIVNV